MVLEPVRKGNVVPQSIPKGLTKEQVIRALGDLDVGIDHPFEEPFQFASFDFCRLDDVE